MANDNGNWGSAGTPSWGSMPNPGPVKSSGPDTAGTKGKIIMSQNVVTRKGQDPSTGGAPQSMEK
jgi:hypothetical protein